MPGKLFIDIFDILEPIEFKYYQKILNDNYPVVMDSTFVGITLKYQIENYKKRFQKVHSQIISKVRVSFGNYD